MDVRPFRKELVTTALESGADVVIAPSASPVKALGRVSVVSDDGDLVWGTDVFEVRIEGEHPLLEAEAPAGKGYVIVETGDWRVILENLVALSIGSSQQSGARRRQR